MVMHTTLRSLSLLIINTFMLRIVHIQEDVDITLDAELYLNDDPQRPRRHRCNKLSGAELPPECRVMSLSSFPLTSLVASDGDAHSLNGYHYVAAGCSDALIRQVKRLIHCLRVLQFSCCYQPC